MMGGENGGRRGGISCHSVGSYGSRSFMRRKRKNEDIICHCGLKTLIKKSGTSENLDKLFYICPRYRVSYQCSIVETSNDLSWILTFWYPDVVQKGSHCNYFRWAEDDDYEGLENLGEVKTDAQMENDAALLNHNISWRMMTVEAEVKALRMQLYFGLIVVILVFMIMCMFFSGK